MPKAAAFDSLAANRSLATRRHPDDAPDPAKRRSGSRRTVTVNLREHVTSWLHHRGLLSDRQLVAAERLRADYERSGLGARVTMQWDRPAAGKGRQGSMHGSDPTLAQIDARRRFDAALERAGPGLSDICWRIICANEGMADAERMLGWPARSGRLVLALALDRVADYYGV